MYWHKTPFFFELIFPKVLWKKKEAEKVIYLTFDDGPIPEATPWLIELLKQYNAKATFFMVGENITKHPDVFELVRSEGHSIGNHTYNHLKGWQTDLATYVQNIEKAENEMGANSKGLFRPPHGQLSWPQYKHIKKSSQVVMWDVLSGDFDQNISPERCLSATIKATKKGSIVVFHDSIKSIALLKSVLPAYLDHFSSQDYSFKAL